MKYSINKRVLLNFFKRSKKKKNIIIFLNFKLSDFIYFLTITHNFVVQLRSLAALVNMIESYYQLR